MHKVLQAIIVDDEPGARSLIRSYISQYTEVRVIEECGTGVQAVAAINRISPDLVFLDIQMPNMSGFDVLKEIKDPYPVVIFITAFDAFAIKAFEVNALDYLLKPFDRARFDQSIQRALDYFANKEEGVSAKHIQELLASVQTESDKAYKNKLIVKSKSKSVFIDVDEIECVEGYDNYVKIFTSSGYKVGNYTLKELEKELDPLRFTRVHRSYLVQLSKIKALEPFTHGEYILYMESGKEVKLSRTYKEKLQMIIQ